MTELVGWDSQELDPSYELRREQMLREQAINLAKMFARMMRGLIERWS